MPRPTPPRAAAPPAGPELPYGYTGRRLGRAVIGLVLAVVGTITLVPFAFAWPERFRVVVWNNAVGAMVFDLVANVALFVPLGFLYALTRAAERRSTPGRAVLARALLLGAAASLLVETAQLFEPERYASPLDVTTNALGALLGAWAHRRVAAHLGADTRLVGRLALELPLMGLVYLLVPLCTLAALTLAGAPPAAAGAPTAARPFGLVALALFGGTLLGQVQRRHLGPAGALSARGMGVAAAGWFALAAVPALATGPLAFGVGVAAAGGAAWAYGRAPLPPGHANRRFEVAALARAAPYLAAYLALLALGDPPRLTTHGLTQLEVLRRVEALVAFVALGYVLAEGWGRLDLRYRHSAGRVALVAVVGSVLAEALRIGAVPAGDVVPGVAARVLAAAYGGWIYHLQRAHVRALVAARAGVAADAVEEPRTRAAA